VNSVVETDPKTSKHVIRYGERVVKDEPLVLEDVCSYKCLSLSPYIYRYVLMYIEQNIQHIL
jgi:hypothetical protein